MSRTDPLVAAGVKRFLHQLSEPVDVPPDPAPLPLLEWLRKALGCGLTAYETSRDRRWITYAEIEGDDFRLTVELYDRRRCC